MSNTKESFILFADYIHPVLHLSMEQRGLLLTAALCYVNGEALPELDQTTLVLWEIWKNNIDRNAEKWDEVRQRRVSAGRKGGLTSRRQEEATPSTAKHCLANEAVNVPVPVNVNGNGNVPVRDEASPPDRYIYLPLKNGENYVVTPHETEEYARQFPSLDLPAAFQNIQRWLEDNPSRRKDRAYMPTFLKNWLTRDAQKTARKEIPDDTVAQTPPPERFGTVL